MSTPPPYYPPPQGYGGQPPRQNSNSGCLKAAGITCGVMALFMIIGGIMAVSWFKTQMRNPTGVFSQGMKVATAGMQGAQIQQAVVRYKNQTGNYPPNLTALVPQYIDGKLLHSSVDSNPSPGHISWTYIRPGPGSSGKSPLLILPYSMTMTIGNQTRTVPGQIVINLDGTSGSRNGPSGGYERSPANL